MRTAIFWQQKVGNFRDSYILICSFFWRISSFTRHKGQKEELPFMKHESRLIPFLCDRHHSCDRDTNITMIFTQQQTTQREKNWDILSQSSENSWYLGDCGWTFVSVTAFGAKTECHALRATHCHYPITLEPSFILHKKFRGFLKMHLNRPKTG